MKLEKGLEAEVKRRAEADKQMQVRPAKLRATKGGLAVTQRGLLATHGLAQCSWQDAPHTLTQA